MQIGPARGRNGTRNGGIRIKPRRENSQVLKGMSPCRGQLKEDERTGEEAEKTGSRRRAKRDLRGRSREARQRAHRRAVDTGGSGPLYRLTGGSR